MSDARQLLEAIDEPALIVRRGTVQIANEAAKTLLGPRVEGSDIRLAIRHPSALELLFRGERGTVEISGVGGFARPWTVSTRPLEPGELLVRFTDRAATVAAEKMRVDFVANASHELRTPLSTILGYAETLADESSVEDELRQQFANVIRTEAKRMLAIIEDLMNLSRIEAGRFVTPTEPVDLAELVRTAAGNQHEPAGRDGERIEIDIGTEIPPVRGDPPQLLQLLDNLFTNALRYGCPKDGDRVRVRLTSEGGWVRLSVSDNGPGIPRDHLPRVTERFYRVDAGRSRESGGTGLGLAIVKHIVERHRGRLDIRSALGEGTEVSVSLPAIG